MQARHRLIIGVWLIAAAGLASSAPAAAARPDALRYPNLVKSWEALQLARDHLRRAEANHLKHGTLGGHAAKAVEAVDAAQAEIDLAVAFAEAHRKDGPPGVVTPNPFGLESRVAMQYHAPIGTLGGHGERAIEHLRRALGQITEAERWSDTHAR
jgi:hypothetical protein